MDCLDDTDTLELCRTCLVDAMDLTDAELALIHAVRGDAPMARLLELVALIRSGRSLGTSTPTPEQAAWLHGVKA